MTDATDSHTAATPEEGVTTALYRAAIGPVNTAYYLPIFSRFEAADHAGITWNTAASLSTLNWLVFRQLWSAALAYVGALVTLVLLLFGIGKLVFQWSDTLVSALALGFGLAAFVLPGLFGNALFHIECRKRMGAALAANSSVEDACAHLNRQASSKRRLIGLAAANAATLAVAALVYVQLSALSTLAVMPHGALDAGHVAVGKTADGTAVMGTTVAASDTTTPLQVASAAAPASAASMVSTPAASAPAAAASSTTSTLVGQPVAAPASAPATVPASATPASGPIVAASAPIAAASASTSATLTPRASAPIPAATASTASAPASKASAVKPTKAIAVKPGTAASAPVAAASTPAPKSKKAENSDNTPKREKPTAAALRKAVAAPSSPTPASAASAPTSSGLDKPYFINVGLFAKPSNAANAHAKLTEAQLPSVTRVLKTPKGPLTRVRVGPFTSEQDAQDAVAKIQALQLDAVIVQP